MNKYSIEITVPAEKDLREIANYISNELLEPDIALRIITKIGNAIMTLEEMPQRNPLIADTRLSLLGIRRIMVDNYIIFYVISDKLLSVTVVRILYSKRDWINLL